MFGLTNGTFCFRTFTVVRISAFHCTVGVWNLNLSEIWNFVYSIFIHILLYDTYYYVVWISDTYCTFVIKNCRKKRTHKIYTYYKLHVLQWISENGMSEIGTTYLVRISDSVRNRNCFTMELLWKAPKSERSDFGHLLYIYINYIKWSSILSIWNLN